MDSRWLQALRKRRGLTQQAVAGVIGVTANTVARWERGEEAPSRHHWIALDALLGGARHLVLTHLLREMREESRTRRERAAS